MICAFLFLPIRFFPNALGIAVLLLLAACGPADDTNETAAPRTTAEAPEARSEAISGDIEAGAAQPGIDVCALLTPDEIQLGLGEGAEPESRMLSPGWAHCDLANGEPQGARITVVSQPDFVHLDGLAENWIPASGIGDQAVERHFDDFYQLRALQGPYRINVDYHAGDLDEAGRKQVAVQLAEAVISRLP